jgi:hypothetical protein
VLVKYCSISPEGISRGVGLRSKWQNLNLTLRAGKSSYSIRLCGQELPIVPEIRNQHAKLSGLWEWIMFENKIPRAEGLRPYCVGIIFYIMRHPGEGLINMKLEAFEWTCRVDESEI